MEKLLARIVLDPKIMVGKPTIKGTRITVQLILGLLAEGAAPEEIILEYPHITKEDIYACLLFAQHALDDLDFVPLLANS